MSFARIGRRIVDYPVAVDGTVTFLASDTIPLDSDICNIDRGSSEILRLSRSCGMIMQCYEIRLVTR